MTKADKPVTRESYSRYRGREVIVTIHPTWLSLRLKGTRKSFALDIEAAYQRAAYLEAESKRLEKRAAKKAATKGTRGKKSYVRS